MASREQSAGLDHTTTDRPMKEGLISPKIFAITGWEDARTSYFLTQDKEAVSRAIQICEEEIVLIDEEIRNYAIPYPQAIRQGWSHVEPHVKAVRLMPPDLHLSSDSHPCPSNIILANHSTKSWHRQKFFHWGSLRRAYQLIFVANAIIAAARQGPIILVGAGLRAQALARFLQTIGRDVIQLESAYGNKTQWLLPGMLCRPEKNSFLAWFSMEPAVRLERAGALVFLDPHYAAEDFAVLTGLERYTPPIILPGVAASGIVRSISVGRTDVLVPERTPWYGPLSIGPERWPKISIVTVSFNQVQFLEHAIQSVLEQNYPNLEYIVVDGGSTDGSLEIIEKYRPQLTHVIIEPDQGQSDALNKGFNLATGDIMNWLCSDDMLEPGSLTRIAASYRRSKPDLIVGGGVRIGNVRSDELSRQHSAIPFGRVMPLPFSNMLQFMRSWYKGNYFFQPEVFFSRRIWEASGGFIKRRLYYAMDYDLWLRMAMAGATVLHLPDITACSRVHGTQKTKDDRVYLHQIRLIMNEYRAALTRIAALMR
jgi:GT2 family glycosyltransferase